MTVELFFHLFSLDYYSSITSVIKKYSGVWTSNIVIIFCDTPYIFVLILPWISCLNDKHKQFTVFKVISYVVCSKLKVANET